MDSDEVHFVDIELPGKSSGKLFGRGGKKLSRIQETFGVTVDVTSHGPSEIARVRGAREVLTKAEHYISAICGIGQQVERKVPFPNDMREELVGNNEQHHRDLEARSGALVRFLDSEAQIVGRKLAVEVAASQLGNKIKLYKKLRADGHDIADFANQRPAVVSAMLHVEGTTDGTVHSDSSSADESEDGDSSAEVSRISGKPDPELIKDGVELGWREEEVVAVAMQLGGAPDRNCLLHRLLKCYPNPSSNSSLSPAVRTVGESTENQYTSGQSRTPPNRAKSLRPIVIDGSNVALTHSKGKHFSCRGILKCVEYFRERGHTEITCFVPMWRKETSRPEAPITNQEILLKLYEEEVVSFTPSRRVNGKRITCYDDRYVVQLADETGGIIVSNDNFRDLLKEKPKLWRTVIEERLLMYSFAQDRFMPPDDPLGQGGPSLDEFLRFPDAPCSDNNTCLATTVCPYDLMCTYSTKCKYGLHPKRDQSTKGHASSQQTSAQQTSSQRVGQHDMPDLVPKGPEARKKGPRRWDLLTGSADEYAQPPSTYYQSMQPVQQAMYPGMDMHYQQPQQEYYNHGPANGSNQYSYAPPFDMPPMPSSEQYPPQYYQSTLSAQADMQAFMERRNLRTTNTYQHAEIYPNVTQMSQEQHGYHSWNEPEAYIPQQQCTAHGYEHDQYSQPQTVMPSQQWSGYNTVQSNYASSQQMMPSPMNGYNSFAEDAVRSFSNHFQERVIREVVRLNPTVDNLDALYGQIILFIQRQHAPSMAH